MINISLFLSYRFLQTAEMLKPSSTTIMDQDYVEYYPHVVFLQNKVGLQDFMPSIIDQMKVCSIIYIINIIFHFL